MSNRNDSRPLSCLLVLHLATAIAGCDLAEDVSEPAPQTGRGDETEGGVVDDSEDIDSATWQLETSGHDDCGGSTSGGEDGDDSDAPAQTAGDSDDDDDSDAPAETAGGDDDSDGAATYD